MEEKSEDHSTSEYEFVGINSAEGHVKYIKNGESETEEEGSGY